ncbi:4641_t:CDS:1 [Ambispora leptoticha]|uniref:4641_t:CDS:1 n=1 Tax=Ambispora leptoticha TaxID=144679 RepID=A0A9N8W5W6_9GLOM|nr:4641_t:CDS:1 [Ambispora leptoticha]
MATTIKVKYQSTVRRLTIPNDETNSWTDFETQLRTLFSIPETNPISVSYTDDDGDVITLSSDLELHEVISNNTSPSKTLSFVISTVNDDDHSTKHPENDSWVLEGNVLPYIIDNKATVEEKQETEATVPNESEGTEKLTNKNSNNKESSEEDKSLQNDHHLHTSIADEAEEPEFAPTITIEENNADTIKDNKSINDEASSYSSKEKGKQKQVSIEESTASNDETSKKEESNNQATKTEVEKESETKPILDDEMSLLDDWLKMFYNITVEQPTTNDDSEKNSDDNNNAESSSKGRRRILLKISSQPTQDQFCSFNSFEKSRCSNNRNGCNRREFNQCPGFCNRSFLHSRSNCNHCGKDAHAGSGFFNVFSFLISNAITTIVSVTFFFAFIHIIFSLFKIVLPIAAVVVPTFFAIHFLNKIITGPFHGVCNNRGFLERQQRSCGNRHYGGYNRETPIFFYRRHYY